MYIHIYIYIYTYILNLSLSLYIYIYTHIHVYMYTYTHNYKLINHVWFLEAVLVQGGGVAGEVQTEEVVVVPWAA